MRVSSIILGTFDWLKEDALGELLRIALQPVRLRILEVMPKGCLLIDQFKGKNNRIALRAGHVPNEKHFVHLANTKKPFETSYVIHYHEANKAGNHFDLRILYKGKAVSWAIPMKGIREGKLALPQSGQRWLALRQPDHTQAYMNFEGEITEGYGKGRVSIWDKGIADILKIEDGQVHLKLHGSNRDSLVITPTTDRRSLLIGKREEPGTSWEKPPFKKEPESRIAELEKDKSKIAENKIDGATMEAVLGEKYNRIFSHRTSKKTGVLIEHSDRLPHFRDYNIPSLKDTIIRVEGFHPNGVDFLAGTLNSNIPRAREVQAEHGPIQLAILDVLRYKGRDVSSLPYSERRILAESISKKMSPASVVTPKQANGNWNRFYRDVSEDESIPSDGIVIKDLNSGFSQTPIIKIRPYTTEDLEVVEITEGNNKNLGKAGALIVKGPKGRNIRVGTGLTDFQREWIWKHRDELIGEVAKVKLHVRHGKVTNTGPRFDGWHPDKSEAGLKMYADIMGVSPYAIKSAAGWRKR